MEDREFTIIHHLEELRTRIIIVIAAFLVFFVVGFVYVEKIYLWITRNLEVKLIVLGPSDIIGIYFMIATIMAVAGTIPILATQIWLFIKPALLPHERKVSLSYVPALFILFIIGFCFGYFVIFPTVMNFIIRLGGDMMVTNFTAEKYFRFLLTTTLPFGILFELPVVLMLLTSLGIINPYVLQKIRKYAYFILIVIAVVISPPDVVSDFLVSVPLLFLYEISVHLSKIVFKRKIKRSQLWEDAVDVA